MVSFLQVFLLKFFNNSCWNVSFYRFNSSMLQLKLCKIRETGRGGGAVGDFKPTDRHFIDSILFVFKSKQYFSVSYIRVTWHTIHKESHPLLHVAVHYRHLESIQCHRMRQATNVRLKYAFSFVRIKPSVHTLPYLSMAPKYEMLQTYQQKQCVLRAFLSELQAAPSSRTE
jgi:hypothetical protein